MHDLVMMLVKYDIADKINALKADRDATIMKLLAAGATYLKVAEAVGSSLSKVQDLAKVAGLLRQARASSPSGNPGSHSRTQLHQDRAEVRARKRRSQRGRDGNVRPFTQHCFHRRPRYRSKSFVRFLSAFRFKFGPFRTIGDEPART